jgi:hypothetical protein
MEGDKHSEQTLAWIVLEEANGLLDKDLYLDSWYIIPELVDILCTRRADVAGTIRMNRKDSPVFLRKAKLLTGEFVITFWQKMMILKWKDKQDMTLVKYLWIWMQRSMQYRSLLL